MSPAEITPAPVTPTGYDVAGPDNTGRILRRRKWTILLVTLVLGVGGYVVSSVQPPAYQSVASIEVRDLNQDFMGGRDVNPVAEADSRFGAENDVQTQIRILQSPSLLEKAARAAGVEPPPNATERQREIWREQMADQVHVRAVGQTRVVEVVAEATQPKVAADLANSLCRAYIEQAAAARTSVASGTSNGLNQQLDDMRSRLEQSENALQEYIRTSNLLMTGDRETVQQDKLKEIQAELVRAQSDLAAKQSTWEMARKASPDSLPDVLDDNEYRDVSTKLADLKSQEAQLDATYQPDFRKNTQLHAAVSSLEASATAKRNALVERVQNEFIAAQGREKLLATQYQRQAGLVVRDADRSVRYNQLRRDMEGNQQLYEVMVQKVRESAVASAIPARNVRIIDVAQPAPRPYKPRTALNTLVAFVAGLIFSVALVLLQERTNTTIREAGTTPLFLQLPELAVIPREGGRKGLAMEGYRSAATSVLFAAAGQSAVLVTTSGAANEGKTTVCCGLAKALAERGKRVLIIDADLRRPSVHDRFGELKARNQDGLIQVLEGESEEKVILTTSTENLSVLLSGGSTTTDAALLGSPAMADLIPRLREKFDMILIDTPPLLGLPSARILGRISNGVILVFRAAKTTRGAALAAVERLADDQITVTGTILTDFDPKFSPDGPYTRAYK
jgi:capsular exopolysaccharide synthesis family protein